MLGNRKFFKVDIKDLSLQDVELKEVRTKIENFDSVTIHPLVMWAKTPAQFSTKHIWLYQ